MPPPAAPPIRPFFLLQIRFLIFPSPQWCSQFQDNTNAQGKTQIPIRLIVPASQCGSLIGKFLGVFLTTKQHIPHSRFSLSSASSVAWRRSVSHYTQQYHRTPSPSNTAVISTLNNMFCFLGFCFIFSPYNPNRKGWFQDKGNPRDYRVLDSGR